MVRRDFFALVGAARRGGPEERGREGFDEDPRCGVFLLSRGFRFLHERCHREPQSGQGDRFIHASLVQPGGGSSVLLRSGPRDFGA